MIAGRGFQGLGLAIIGGTLGFILALSTVLYKTSSWATLLRGGALFAKLTAAKNIPFGEKLIPYDPADLEGQFAQTADLRSLDDRMYIGLRVGWAVAVVPGVWIALNIQNHNAEPEPFVIEVLKRCVIGFFFVALVGGVCGMALGGLTVPGIHQRNILLGTALGSVIGLGFGTALAQNALQPGIFFAISVGSFAFLGLIGGLLSAENFQPAAETKTSDVDSDRD